MDENRLDSLFAPESPLFLASSPSAGPVPPDFAFVCDSRTIAVGESNGFSPSFAVGSLSTLLKSSFGLCFRFGAEGRGFASAVDGNGGCLRIIDGSGNDAQGPLSFV